jgi:hypothetical protein
VVVRRTRSTTSAPTRSRGSRSTDAHAKDAPEARPPGHPFLG